MTQDEAFKAACQQAMAEGRAITIMEGMHDEGFFLIPSCELHTDDRDGMEADEVLPPGEYVRTRVFVSGHAEEPEEFYVEGEQDVAEMRARMLATYPTAKRIHVAIQWSNT
jgi:hypothetical protein